VLSRPLVLSFLFSTEFYIRLRFAQERCFVASPAVGCLATFLRVK
jgi:hypothetical protein